jgi:hypothetical protein
MWKVIWPAAGVALVVDLGADLLWGNATVNLATFAITFAAAAFVIHGVRSSGAAA